MLKGIKEMGIIRKNSFIIIIFILALGLRLLVLMNTEDCHGVAAGRAIQARLFLENGLIPGEWYSPVHPPAHLAILTLGLAAWNHPLAPRLISLIFGVFLIFPFYFLVKRLFGKSAGLLSALGAALYSTHIIYSCLGTGETLFQFLLVSGLLLFVRHVQEEEPGMLVGSAVLIGLAGLCRYEGILFIPALSVLLLRRPKQLAWFVVLSLGLPLLWMGFNYCRSGDALHFITINNNTVPVQYDWIRRNGTAIDAGYKALFWPRSLIAGLGPMVALFGAVGLVLALLKREKEKLLLALGFCLLAALFMAATLAEALYVQPRYGITLGLLLIPFAVYAGLRLIQMTGNRLPAWTVLALLWTMIPPLAVGLEQEPTRIPEFIIQTAAYLNANCKVGDRIVVTHCGDEKYREPLKWRSRLSPAMFSQMPYQVPRNGEWVADREKFFKVLSRDRITLLVYSPLGELGKVLELEKDRDIQQWQGINFILEFQTGDYSVYRVFQTEVR